MESITQTLRDEARFRPTIWGDARPLLIAAADRLEAVAQLLRQHQCCADGMDTVAGCIGSGRCKCSAGLLLGDDL